jgi:hypothetical protein
MEHFPIQKKLHTDVLEEKYGKIDARILKHDNEIREAHLVDPEGISRTYAVTFLNFDKENKELSQINSEIKGGGLIGETFRKHGYEVRKNVIDVYPIELPFWLKEDFHSDEDYAKARLSEFYARKEGDPVIYGTVVEIYHPDFRSSVVNEADIKQIQPSTEMFERAGIERMEIWNRLGETKDWDDLGERYSKAKQLSLPFVFRTRQKLEKHLLTK